MAFGAQTLVHDFINGFFILLDKQYDIGDNIRVAGVQGAVEEYLMLVKTRPFKQGVVKRELQQGIKDCFEKNGVKTAFPGRV